MKVQDIIKKQTTVIALAIVLISIALIGISYAIFFDVKSNELNQVIKAGTLELSISGVNNNNPINVSNVISLDEAKELEPISYTISNSNSDIPATYEIYLYTNETNTVNHDYIYISISDNGNEFTEPVILSSLIDKDGSFTQNGINYYKIESGVLEIGTQTETKYLRIWLDDSLISEDIENKTANFKLDIISEAGGVKDYILAHSKIGEGAPNFSKTSYSTCDTANDTTCEATVGIYKAADDDGTTYYYRGDVTDNYMKFAGFYWRIIRINGNGSIRMIYTGDASVIDNLENREEVLSNGYDDSETTYFQIGESAFNTSKDQAEYVGFKYTLGTANGNGTKSEVLKALESWYESEDNELQDYEEYLDIESGFCGDRSAYTNSNGTIEGGGTGTTNTYYGVYVRLSRSIKNPSFKCPDIKNNLYTTSISGNGNKSLDYPIGLITADEAAFAGALHYNISSEEGNNKEYYLYTGVEYWTMSPTYSSGGTSYVLRIRINGDICYTVINSNGTVVRPVINIKPNKIAGTGTINSPYYIP
ncbi:MAG: hypothetical protein E7163_03755 [Firmicutes bacterium]|nr:hypothetical protein [Bacillota bacterium]